jgi:hypothetical protein
MRASTFHQCSYIHSWLRIREMSVESTDGFRHPLSRNIRRTRNIYVLIGRLGFSFFPARRVKSEQSSEVKCGWEGGTGGLALHDQK